MIKTTYRLKLFLASLCLNWMILFCPALVQAAEFKGLSVFPASFEAGKPGSKARFEYELYPGETKTDTLRVINRTGQDANFYIFPADGTTTADGAFALSGHDDVPQEVGAWISLNKNEVFIGHNQEALIDFTVSVPEKTEVGDHLGGISVFNLNQDPEQKIQDGIALSITTRVGTRVYVTVPGELRRKMEMTDFSAQLDPKTDKLVFSFGLVNQGNVRLEPKGEIKVQNMYFSPLSATLPIDLRLVLPDKPTQVPVVWRETPLLGKYLASAQVRYGDKPNQVIHQQLEISFITKKAKIIMAVSAAVLLILGYFVIKKLTTFKTARR